MVTIKYLFLLLITIFIAALGFFNPEYFLTTASLKLNFQDMVYAIPELPTYAYMGICFLLGFIIAWIGKISVKFRLNKIIRQKDADLQTLEVKALDLQTQLDGFTQDPFIKKGLENKLTTKSEEAIIPETDMVPASDLKSTEETIKPEDDNTQEEHPETMTESDTDKTEEDMEKTPDSEKDKEAVVL